MRSLLTGALAALMFSTAALAAEVEGKVTSVDRDNLTITLENGKSYKLPGEIDVDAIQEGMQVLLAYDKVGDQNMITDMELPE
jgi:opacity protein-like surface antigen